MLRRELEEYQTSATVEVKDCAQIYKVAFTDPNMPKTGLLKILKERKGKAEYKLHKIAFSLSSNIIEPYGIFVKSKKAYFFQELGWKDLDQEIIERQKIQNFWEETDLIDQFILLTYTVNELHQHCFVHRDIKPKNIILTENSLKLADFGESKVVENELLSSTLGTVEYMSPELKEKHDNKENYCNFPFQNDIWALGITFVEMACLDYIESITNPNLDEVESALKTRDISPDLIDILLKMFRHPQERISARTLLSELQAFKEKNWITLPCQHRFKLSRLKTYVDSSLRTSCYVNCPTCKKCFIDHHDILDKMQLSSRCIKKIKLIKMRSQLVECPHCYIKRNGFRKLDEKFQPYIVRCLCNATFCSCCLLPSHSK